jgi:hypothetical protein
MMVHALLFLSPKERILPFTKGILNFQGNIRFSSQSRITAMGTIKLPHIGIKAIFLMTMGANPPIR